MFRWIQRAAFLPVVAVAAWAGLYCPFTAGTAVGADGAPVSAGFAEGDITPEIVKRRPVYLAGYGTNRKATGVHDPLMARAVVLQSGEKKIALVGVDLIGLQYPTVLKIREQLSDFQYVMVASTHSHEGPDVIGIWGPTPLKRGVDDAYVEKVIETVVATVRKAAEKVAPMQAKYGTAEDEALLGDSRLPHVKDGVLRVLSFTGADKAKPAGLVVQWNCHPEAMGSKNTLLTADFVWATVAKLKEQYGCPVVFLSGAVGGLLAPPDHVIKDANGKELEEGDFEYTRIYGEAVAALATKAIDAAKPIELVPFAVSAKLVGVPVTNPLYRLARSLGVVQRDARIWTGDAEALGDKVTRETAGGPTAVETEVAYLRLGELHVACIPGELYPELVYGKFQEPVEPNADFPDAPLEPSVASLMPSDRWMLIGLANDEVGYIIPKRQFDRVAPFAYGKDGGQYGEVNSCGPDVAPILMESLKRRVGEAATH